MDGWMDERNSFTRFNESCITSAVEGCTIGQIRAVEGISTIDPILKEKKLNTKRQKEDVN